MILNVYCYQDSQTKNYYNICCYPDIYSAKDVAAELSGYLVKLIKEHKIDPALRPQLFNSVVVKLGSINMSTGLMDSNIEVLTQADPEAFKKLYDSEDDKNAV